MDVQIIPIAAIRKKRLKMIRNIVCRHFPVFAVLVLQIMKLNCQNCRQKLNSCYLRFSLYTKYLLRLFTDRTFLFNLSNYSPIAAPVDGVDSAAKLEHTLFIFQRISGKLSLFML